MFNSNVLIAIQEKAIIKLVKQEGSLLKTINYIFYKKELKENQNQPSRSCDPLEI